MSGLAVWFNNNITASKIHALFLKSNKPQGLDGRQIRIDRSVGIARRIK